MEVGFDLVLVCIRGVFDGDEWVINGYKIWMLVGIIVNWIFLLVWIDFSVVKYWGLLFLLVFMD